MVHLSACIFIKTLCREICSVIYIMYMQIIFISFSVVKFSSMLQ